ncbi:MAG: sulfite exporter TauE/SafE family protein [bacterium]|nr:sulfite exporter TauE/SafE family protein [bacterium]
MDARLRDCQGKTRSSAVWGKIAFISTFFIAYTIQAITGFAGNIFAMPVGTIFLGVGSSVAILNAMGCLACGMVAFVNIKSINWRELGKICLVMGSFMFVGIWLDRMIPANALLKVYATTTVLIGCYYLFLPKKRKLPDWLLYIVLAIAGVIQGMLVCGGAFLAVYAVQKIEDKQQFRATLSMVWTILNFIYAMVAIYLGHYTPEVVQIVLICIPVSVIATVIGQYLQKKMSQERFLKFIYGLLIAIGLVTFFARAQ